MPTPIVISCFDLTTTLVQPWAEAGYLCYCVDLQHPPGETREGNIIRVGIDVREWLPPYGPVAFAAFFPPCTDTAISGRAHFRRKGLSSVIKALQLFEWSARLAAWCQCPYFIENPVSTVSTYWRPPDFRFDPCDYAGYLSADSQLSEAYTKRTCLWTGGGFQLPEPKAVVPILGSKMHNLPDSKGRANLRSATPAGFARAVFEANCLTSAPVEQTS